MSTEQTIHLIGDFRRDEKLAVAALSPGHVLELTSADKVQKQSTADAIAEKLVAVEDALQGNTIADAYSAADLVSFNIYARGAEAQVFLKAGEDVSIGDKLELDGTGCLVAVASGDPFAVAMEAQDLSSSTAVDTLTHVRFL